MQYHNHLLETRSTRDHCNAFRPKLNYSPSSDSYPPHSILAPYTSYGPELDAGSSRQNQRQSLHLPPAQSHHHLRHLPHLCLDRRFERITSKIIRPFSSRPEIATDNL